ncbi:helix-turn-helix domain-containing protein [Ruminococcaceae bacterium OttesenSCG-928-I18]|nr:helix-turn-helix domain-containing protein [Ruminococcaceae bacterium OttesenSCG-928-I18]
MDKGAIGKKLKTMRGSKSRRDVASAINVSESAIRMYESGQRIPRDEIKTRYAEYFDVSVSDLFFASK